ncbi:chemotaxis protein [Marivirga arenosa]|uniref:Chemotaxis protein n=1 Tax=Marivirga arenosa TaxID=3059076 RepID=A0AA49GEI0_9BACT|nr:chemotaxis protein [Marivirga sp. BKB1-2]WKK82264.2 chemotaxis protein [Marivirga sp. BKB1-2]
MSLINKIKWILGILMVFILIISTNLIDRKNFQRVRDSVVSIYEDRLLAKEIIFNISNILHEKEIALVEYDTAYFSIINSQKNKELNSELEKFKKTKLTKKEERVFNDLQTDLSSIIELEKNIDTKDFKNNKNLNDKIKIANQHLKQLSEIQITEGNRQLSISQKAVRNVELYTQIEIYILIFLAVIIQIIIMYQPKND